jgi:hypothetical protein
VEGFTLNYKFLGVGIPSCLQIFIAKRFEISLWRGIVALRVWSMRFI